MSDVTPPEGLPEQPSEPTAPPAGGYGTPPPPPPPPPPAPPAYGTPPPPAGAGGQPFSVGEAFGWAWAKFQANVGPILIAMLVYVVALVVVTVFAYLVIGGLMLSSASVTIDPNTGAISTTGGTGFFVRMIASGLILLVIMIPFAFLQAAIVRGGLLIADGRRLDLGDMFKFDQVGQVLVGAIIVGFATMIGSILCYFPALIVGFFTAFYLFFIVDKNMGAWEGIMASVKLVMDHLGEVFVLLLLAWVTYFVGALLCGIGLIVAAPVALLALTYGFRRLQNEPVAA